MDRRLNGYLVKVVVKWCDGSMAEVTTQRIVDVTQWLSDMSEIRFKQLLWAMVNDLDIYDYDEWVAIQEVIFGKHVDDNELEWEEARVIIRAFDEIDVSVMELTTYKEFKTEMEMEKK